MSKTTLLAKVLVASALIAAPAAALAESTFLHEVTGGTANTFSFAGGSTQIGFAAGYRFMALPEPGVQAGYDTTFSYLTANDTGVTTWDNFFGPRLNFGTDPNLLNRFFIDGGIGFSLRHSSVGSVGVTTTRFLYGGAIGKRFQLGSNVAYVPQFSVRKIEDSSVRFTITPIAFSVFFG